MAKLVAPVDSLSRINGSLSSLVALFGLASTPVWSLATLMVRFEYPCLGLVPSVAPAVTEEAWRSLHPPLSALIHLEARSYHQVFLCSSAIPLVQNSPCLVPRDAPKFTFAPGFWIQYVATF